MNNEEKIDGEEKDTPAMNEDQPKQPEGVTEDGKHRFFNETEYVDREIMPLLKQLKEKCEAKKIPMIAYVCPRCVSDGFFISAIDVIPAKSPDLFYKCYKDHGHLCQGAR